MEIFNSLISFANTESDGFFKKAWNFFWEIFDVKNLPTELTIFCILFGLSLATVFGVYAIRSESVGSTDNEKFEIYTHNIVPTILIFLSFTFIYIGMASALKPRYELFYVISLLSLILVPVCVFGIAKGVKSLYDSEKVTFKKREVSFETETKASVFLEDIIRISLSILIFILLISVTIVRIISILS